MSNNLKEPINTEFYQLLLLVSTTMILEFSVLSGQNGSRAGFRNQARYPFAHLH